MLCDPPQCIVYKISDSAGKSLLLTTTWYFLTVPDLFRLSELYTPVPFKRRTCRLVLLPSRAQMHHVLGAAPRDSCDLFCRTPTGNGPIGVPSGSS